MGSHDPIECIGMDEMEMEELINGSGSPKNRIETINDSPQLPNLQNEKTME